METTNSEALAALTVARVEYFALKKSGDGREYLARAKVLRLVRLLGLEEIEDEARMKRQYGDYSQPGE